MAKDLNRLPQFGLALDWETSGYTLPNYTDRHQGISYGAIVFDMRTLEPIESLYQEIKFDPKKYSWSIEAEKIHGITKPYLEAHGVSQEEAAFALVGLVSKYMGTEDVVLLGHRVHFDKAFTNQLLESEGLALKYHPTVIDSCSIATVLMELTYSEDIFNTLGLPPRGKHNSLEDITYTLEAVKRMKDFFILGVAVSLQE
jgi:oligoribonuclease (3'-5' exoribonuclease)